MTITNEYGLIGKKSYYYYSQRKQAVIYLFTKVLNDKI